MKKSENNIHTLYVLLFCVAILIPNVVLILGLEKNVINNENRKHTKLPDFELNNPITSIGNFKSYYLENFGLKSTLVNNYIEFKVDFLNENPIPNRVFKGKDDWLFIGNYYNNVLDNSFGNDNFTSKELEGTLDYFEKVKTYLSSLNIDLHVVIPPDKNRVYQEYLPFQLRQNRTKIETLETELKKRLGINIINLYQPIVEQKHTRELYIKTDTHWNYYGSYIGYSTIIDEIKKKHTINKVSLEDYIITEKEIPPLDLSRMINSKEKDIAYDIKLKDSITMDEDSNNRKVRLFIYRDSFTNALYPYLNQTFPNIQYSSGYTIEKNEIEKFKPDILIIEIIERNIDVFSKIKTFKN